VNLGLGIYDCNLNDCVEHTHAPLYRFAVATLMQLTSISKNSHKSRWSLIHCCWTTSLNNLPLHLPDSQLTLLESLRLLKTHLFWVNPFSTWRLHVAWMYTWWVCTRAARKENLTLITLTHTITAYSVSGNVVGVRILICATRQKPCRKRVYPLYCWRPRHLVSVA